MESGLIEITNQEARRISKEHKDLTVLSRWMDEHFDKIFEMAPNNEDYAIGILETRNRKKILELHYFNNKYNPKVINLLNNNISHLLYRYEDNFQ